MELGANSSDFEHPLRIGPRFGDGKVFDSAVRRDTCLASSLNGAASPRREAVC
jgi:hypothetical protein